MMSGKWHEKRQYDGSVKKVLALCDRDLLGKVFSEGECVLDLKTYRAFYEGERLDEAKAIEWLGEARNANVVGEKAVACAKKVFSVSGSAVRSINGVPHLQVYFI
ncbi:DUF424 domain-containing protein [Candidatus Micrarchaeota archaeon]|nr:DUF424 domain-containing protein [Candidatus Micrarchaeota archaeon]